MEYKKKRTQITKLDINTRNILWLCALGCKTYSRRDLHQLAQNADWRDKKGRKLSSKVVSEIVNALLKSGLLQTFSYSSVGIDEHIQDLAVQDVVRNDELVALSDIAQEKGSLGFSRHENTRRNRRIMFYKGETDAFLDGLSSRTTHEDLALLHPFSMDIFQGLPVELQAWYLIDAMPRTIARCLDNSAVVTVFDEFAEKEIGESWIKRSFGFLATWLDIAVARGDLDSLRRLDEVTAGKHSEVHGCIALLEGDFERCVSIFGALAPLGKRRGKLAFASRLPGLLVALILFSKGTAGALEQAGLIVQAGRGSTGKYCQPMNVIGAAITFKQSPSSAKAFGDELQLFSSYPIDTLIAGYVRSWLLSPDDVSMKGTGLPAAAKRFVDFGLAWVAAEAFGLAGKTPLKLSKKFAEKYRAAHAELGTSSIVELAIPEPSWQRSLNAIVELAGEETAVAVTAPVLSERLIWELDTQYRAIDITPHYQKRTRTGWTGGRRVALGRLYEGFNIPSQFGYLTEQDVAICRTMEMTTTRNYGGYPETSYSFDDNSAARALVGHPCIFLPGEREESIEIVAQEPQLKITHGKDGDIELTLEPKPSTGDQTYQMGTESEYRVALVFFSDNHLKLHRMLGGTLKAPAAAARFVLESVQKFTSLVSVHSEIGTEMGEVAGEKERVIADSRPGIHLMPYREGLKVEFFVYPFGHHGPCYRPGYGGDNVFASVEGKPMTTVRNLIEEIALKDRLQMSCPQLAAYGEDGTSFYLPTEEDALDVLVTLEELVDSQQTTLFWPGGKSLSLAGRLSSNSLRLHIRKDREMFAASGSVIVNPELTIDLLQMIDLLDASPSRFVKLDDGRFLALTERLRQQVETLSMFGDRSVKQNKLRFPKVRATVLEALEDTITIKSDKHWKAWVARIKDVSNLRMDVPSTLQTELRDYQEEGYLWMARLAALGVGALLADDMGLGKTIQALTLLLHRVSKGPSLVVAPTSVAYNWKREALQFAPTLNVIIFGEGDRTSELKSLKPFDVLICTYGLLNTETERLHNISWATVILDEAQLIKNEATMRSRSAKGLKADFRLILTGTPVENYLSELWNLFDFLNPGLLGSAKQFQERFAIPVEKDKCSKTRRALKQLIGPFILRRTKSQVLQELPVRTEIVRKVVLTDKEAALYEALRQRAIEKLGSSGDDGANHIQILAEIMRLRRACCHPRLVLGDWDMASAKQTLFCETIEELLANHHKVLVFSQFVDHLAILRTVLEKKNVFYQYLDGSTSKSKRKAAVESFQAGQGDVFLISLKAGGLGLNLTAADYVIHMDPWWNPAVEDQASDRAHRLGQNRPVTIYRFITQGTVEEKIAALHTEKRALADSLLEGSDASGKLSSKALLSLIRE